MAERRNRLSPGGRLRCSASGSANLAQWRASRPAALDLKADVEQFEADLALEVGESSGAAQRALMAAAVAAYSGIKLARKKLSGSRRNSRQLKELLSLLPPLAGSLQRSLRLLGVAAGAGESEEPAAVDTLDRWLARQNDAEAPPQPDLDPSPSGAKP